LINETPISESNEKISTPEKTQFKTIQEKTVSGEQVFIIGDADADEKERSLSKSIKNLGPIDDIFYMADGVTIIDGRHRLAECPNVKFNKRILENVKTEDQAIIVDLAKNCNRRPVSPEEKRQKIGILATKYHKTINEIVDATGIGHTTVDRYYPKPLKDQAHSQSGIASGKARAQIVAEAKERQEATQFKNGIPPSGSADSAQPRTRDIVASFVGVSHDNPEQLKPELSDIGMPSSNLDKGVNVPNWERQTQEPTSEEKADALNAEFDREQQQLEKLINDAKADLPNDFKLAVYNFAFNSAKELTEKRLNDCLTTAIEVLLDFIEREDALQELLKTASERW